MASCPLRRLTLPAGLAAVLVCVAFAPAAAAQPPAASTAAPDQPDAGSGGDATAADAEPSSEPDEEPGPDDGAPGTRKRHPGEALTVFVLTMGPGDHPFYKFGHNAIWVHNRTIGRDRVYNYGTFRFGSYKILLEFWLGRFQYRLSRVGLRSTIRSYARRRRSLVIQQLNLTPDERWRLYQFLEWNYRKENRSYHYDYYRDNCSTRVRDAIDDVIGGRMREAGRGPGSMTYRDHTLRLTANLLIEYIVLHVVMGARIDQPITEWEEAFLPEKLRQLLRKTTVVRDGEEVALVATEKTAISTNRPPPPERPPHWIPHFLAVGLAVGAALALLGRAGRTRRVARVSSAIGIGFFGLLFGLLGTSFCLIWMFTDHEVGYANENTLHCAPWLLALPVFAIGVGRARERATRRAFRLAAAATALSVLGVLLKVLPWFDQHNGQIIAFTLPVTAGMALALYWLWSARRMTNPAKR